MLLTKHLWNYDLDFKEVTTGNGYDGEMHELHCGTFGSTQIESKQYTKFNSLNTIVMEQLFTIVKNSILLTGYDLRLATPWKGKVRL